MNAAPLGGMAALLAPGIPASPRLKAHVDSYRHIYRKRPWYVFHDRAAHRIFRVSAEGGEIIGAMDGRRTLDEICQIGADRTAGRTAGRTASAAPDAVADPHQVAAFVNQLAAMELLDGTSAGDVLRLERRTRGIQRQKLFGQMRNPLTFKIPLLDPTRMLDALLPYVAWIFGPVGLVLWLLAVGAGGAIGILHWGELSQDASDRMLSTENLAVAWMVYPCIKVIHEMMHGLALRLLGVEVRQIGLLFAAFVPVPYVDASASAVLERKWQRILVDSAGVLAELFLGGCALILWANAEPGLLRALCYNVILISGFSTVLFNGNPLQRYDGYYILVDLIEIPGLGSRASRYVGWLSQRYLGGDRAAPKPPGTPAEELWFAVYGPLSFVYRLGLMLVISFFVAERFPGLGLVLAVWSVVGYCWPPLQALYRWVGKKPPQARGPALLRLGMIAILPALLLFAVPVPYNVIAQGVVVMPDEAAVRAATPGLVAKLLVGQGDPVAAGQPIALLVEPATLGRVAQLQARLAETRALYTQSLSVSQSKGALRAEAVTVAEHELAEAQRDAEAQTVRSPLAGTIVLTNLAADMPYRYAQKGEQIAWLWDPARALVRVLVPMSDAAALEETIQGVAIRPGTEPNRTIDAHVVRIVPAASDILFNPVLSLEGGGPFAVTRDSSPGSPVARMQEAAFEIDVRTDEPLAVPALHARVMVRFDLGWKPIGLQLWRRVRLVFLRHLHA